MKPNERIHLFSGRILNRFSKDVGTVDEQLPQAMFETIQVLGVMFGILLVVFIVSPIMIVPALILAIMFYFSRLLYLGAAQNVKRFEGVGK